MEWSIARILLPIILFCIYFKLQKGDCTGPTNNSHSREKLLAHRKVCRGALSLEGKIVLKDASQAPSLFSDRERGDRGERGGGRRGARGSRRQPDAPREERGKSKSDSPEFDAEVGMPVELSPSEYKTHIEPLLNYVAFHRKEPQRIFLPDTTGTAPPPPPPPSRKNDTDGDGAEKANADAQLVLWGAIDLKRSDVALNLYTQLEEDQVELSAGTFRKLIEACIKANDLKNASDFLLKMETSGHTPDTGLLDRVMELYARQKREKETKAAEMSPPLAGAFDFVPSFGKGFYSRVEEFAARLESEGSRTKLVSTAVEFVPTFPAIPNSVNGSEALEQREENFRTKLTAAAKPFEPKFTDTIIPIMPAWTEPASEEHKEMRDDQWGAWNAQEDTYREHGDDLDNSWSDWNQGAWIERSKGKGKSKSKGKVKGKGSAKNGDPKWMSDDSWWKETYWDSNWKNEARSNGEHKYAKTAHDGKKSGGLVWKPKTTNKEGGADVLN